VAAVFLFALTLRVLAVDYASPPESDGITFHRLAVSLVSGDGYARVSGHPSAWVVPGYPLLLAAVYWVVGNDPAVARLVNAFLGALTCALVLLLGRRVFEPRVGLLAGFYAAVSPFFIALVNRILSENLYIPLLLLTALAFHEVISRGRFRDFVGFGLSGSLSILAKPLTIPFLLVALVFLIRQWRGRRLLVKLAVSLLVFILPIGVWTVRNAVALKAFVPLANQGGDTFYVSYNPIGGKIFGKRLDDDPVYVEANRRYPLFTHEVERSHYLTEQGIRTIVEHPERLPRLTMLKVLYFWSPFDWEILDSGSYNAATAILLPFLAIGLGMVGRQWPTSASVLLPPVSMFALALVFYGSPRVRLTIEPFLVVLGASGAVWLWTQARRRAPLTGILAGWFGINLFLALSGDAAKATARTFLEVVGIW